MDFAIVTDGMDGQMTFDPATDGNLANNVFLSLSVDKGSFFQNPDFGSRLYLLKRGKNTARTAALVVDYCKEALQWLLDLGRAKQIDVTTERDLQNLNRLDAIIQVTKADNTVVIFKTFVGVV